MYFRAPVLILFLFVSTWLSAQSPIDSLRSLIKTARNTGDKKLLSYHYSQLGYHYNSIGAYDSSILYYQKSLTLEEIAPNIELLASNLNAIGTAYSYLDH